MTSQKGSLIAHPILAESNFKISACKTPEKTWHKGNSINNIQVWMDLILVCRWCGA